MYLAKFAPEGGAAHCDVFVCLPVLSTRISQKLEVQTSLYFPALLRIAHGMSKNWERKLHGEAVSQYPVLLLCMRGKKINIMTV